MFGGELFGEQHLRIVHQICREPTVQHESGLRPSQSPINQSQLSFRTWANLSQNDVHWVGRWENLRESLLSTINDRVFLHFFWINHFQEMWSLWPLVKPPASTGVPSLVRTLPELGELQMERIQHKFDANLVTKRFSMTKFLSH